MMLTETQVEEEQVKNSHIFHFGTLSMTAEGVCRATEKAVNAAKEAGVLISFDPNLRIPLWKDLQTAKEKMEYGLSQADVCKISEEEVEFLTGEKEIEKGAQILRDRFPVKLLLVTAGAKGSYAFYKDMIVYQPSFKLGGTIETTGAGDTFCGDFLACTRAGMEPQKALETATRASALAMGKKGAAVSIPTLAQVKNAAFV